jgi:tetratricopeptide (TPR) repeat protein
VEKPTSLRGLVRSALISLLLLTLILAPRPLAGYLDLAHARRFEALENYSGAASAYASAAKRIPWQPSLWEKAGQIAWFAGDMENAFACLSKAGERDALSQWGWVYLGEAYQQRGDATSAMTAWERALPSAQAYGLLAQVQRRNGDFPVAIADWQASLAQASDNAAAHYQLGLLLAATAPGDALTELMRAAELDPSLDAQVQSLRTALNTASLSGDPAYQFLVSGRALGALGEWDLAAEAFRNATAVYSDYAEAWAWLSEAKQQQGQDGKIEIERALVLNPDSAMLQGLYGIYLQRQKQPEKAITAFQKAAELEPESPGWQMALGGAYEQTGNLVAALDHYQRATELAPDEATSWQALAEFSLRNGVDLTGTALPAARRLMELANDDWQSYDTAGQILLETGNPVGAEILLKKAIELAPTQAAPSLHLGLLYLQSGDRTAAYFYLDQAKVFDSDGPYGWQAKHLLEQYFP